MRMFITFNRSILWIGLLSLFFLQACDSGTGTALQAGMDPEIIQDSIARMEANFENTLKEVRNRLEIDYAFSRDLSQDEILSFEKLVSRYQDVLLLFDKWSAQSEGREAPPKDFVFPTHDELIQATEQEPQIRKLNPLFHLLQGLDQFNLLIGDALMGMGYNKERAMEPGIDFSQPAFVYWDQEIAGKPTDEVRRKVLQLKFEVLLAWYQIIDLLGEKSLPEATEGNEPRLFLTALKDTLCPGDTFVAKILIAANGKRHLNCSLTPPEGAVFSNVPFVGIQIMKIMPPKGGKYENGIREIPLEIKYLYFGDEGMKRPNPFQGSYFLKQSCGN